MKLGHSDTHSASHLGDLHTAALNNLNTTADATIEEKEDGKLEITMAETQHEEPKKKKRRGTARPGSSERRRKKLEDAA